MPPTRTRIGRHLGSRGGSGIRVGVEPLEFGLHLRHVERQSLRLLDKLVCRRQRSTQFIQRAEVQTGEDGLFHDGYSCGMDEWDGKDGTRSAAQSRPRWRSQAAAKSGDGTERDTASRISSIARWSCGVEGAAKARETGPR